ncbi:hypothetical protein [Saccharothrix hoggarensis]|uniref:Uncharacterized protein n=1 Tax=Saccharothrix hoggarensis TaxID=913853 RepID=A0ABW3QPM1_9PSEU
MRKFAATGSLLAVLLAVVAIPAATAEREVVAPPPACTGLVTQLGETLKTATAPLTATPPEPPKAAAPLGDVLHLLVSMQGARCLPRPPASASAEAEPQARKPELCLSTTMAVFGGVFAVLAKVVPGAVPPDPAKLRNEVSALLKTMNALLTNCGLPAPAGGLPTLPPA